ncbi:putative cytochrome P450 6a14 [Cochliomyia hominivorax]
MISLLNTLLISVFTLMLVWLYNNYTYWKRHGVGYETPLPLIGNFKGIGTSLHFRDITQRLYKKFKGKASFCGYYMFLTKTALIIDLDLIKHVLIKEFSSFHDRAIFNNVEDDPLTGHLLTLEGEQWKAMRTKLTPVFTSARMKYMFRTVVKVGECFASAVKRESVKSQDLTVELKELCARFTTDVIGTCAFGIECNSLIDPNAEFRNKGKSIFAEARHGPLVQMFMVTNPKVARKLHMKFFHDHITEFFLNIVRQTVNYRLENNIKRNDFMDLIIELKAKNEDLAKESKGIDLSQGLTIEQMAAQTFVFFLAGFETSSTTMAFCLYELARNLDIQEKLREEILANIKENKGELTYEGMNSMKYLEQVIAETLRLYPVLPNLIRKSMTDYQIPNSCHRLEKGTTVVIPVAAIHADPEYFPDPEKFDPSRFATEEIEKRHPCAYLPFGDGPRNCIGSRFGKMQTKIGLISLLQRYRFECCAQTEIPVEIDKKNFLITAKNGITLKVISLENI